MKTKLSIIALEDDKYFSIHLKEILSPFGNVTIVYSLDEFQLQIQKMNYQLLITDINLGSDNHGLEALKTAQRVHGLHSIVVSSDTSEATIERAYQLGAHHFLSKDKIQEHLPHYLRATIHRFFTQELQKTLNEKFLTKDFELITKLTEILEKNLHGKEIYITGPTGTGKSLLAQIIHQFVYDESKPFIAINCSELSESLLESELFGHAKGAFTGASESRIGKIKLADGGTLFLDEVATMSLTMQQKLLKVLEEKTFRAVGSNHLEKSNFTLITATCENLEKMVQDKMFREDLYFRIKGHHLHLKSLKERLHDLPYLIQTFQARSPRRFIIKEDAMNLLLKYSWPGNIRELKKVINQLGDLGSGVINEKNIRDFLGSQNSFDLKNQSNEIYLEVKRVGLREYIHRLEKEMVGASLEQNQGKVTEVIKELKISSSAFYRVVSTT